MKTLLTIEEQEVMYRQNLKSIPKIGGNVEVKHTNIFTHFV